MTSLKLMVKFYNRSDLASNQRQRPLLTKRDHCGNSRCDSPTATAWLLGWLGTILRALGLIGRFLVASTSLPRWLIVLLVLALLASVFGALKRRLTAITQPLEIGWLSYTTDVFPGFDGAVWRWRYSGDSILRIVAFCPRCDMQLAARYGPVGFGGYRTTLACENCNWSSSEIEGELNEIISRVERLIQRKLRSGEYKALTHEDR